MTPFLVEAAVVLLVAAIVATFGYSSGKRAVQKRIDDAASAFYDELGRIISKGASEGKFKSAANAREILDRYRMLHTQLDGIVKPLEAGFGELAALEGAGRSQDNDAVFAAIAKLQSSWPAQSRAMEAETRRLLGLLRVE